MTPSRSTSTFRLRFEPASHHFRDACDHRGAFGLDSWTPIVARLNHGRGFLAGASLGRGMLAYLDSTIFADPMAAAIAADDAAAASEDADAADQTQDHEEAA